MSATLTRPYASFAMNSKNEKLTISFHFRGRRSGNTATVRFNGGRFTLSCGLDDKKVDNLDGWLTMVHSFELMAQDSAA